MDEFPHASLESQVSELEESDDATDTAMPQLIPQVNGVRRVNGDNTIPRQGAAVYLPSTITNPPTMTHHGMEAANSQAAYVTQIPRVDEPDMHQPAISRTASSEDTPPRPEASASPEPAGPSPVVLTRQEWMNRRMSRAALLSDWPHPSHSNGVVSQEDHTTLSNWHNTQPSDEPFHNIEEIDHLVPPQEITQYTTNGTPGSDLGAVAGSSPRNPEQAN
ncbi:hypothetical protein PG993_003814 [Apiospora rasikravindrae]|uniref:Uncharacterized protein n=1 Tax=Apiospora rasikravindrae TaxID=990691 RepID=A0ABR1U3C9_9PEZI